MRPFASGQGPSTGGQPLRHDRAGDPLLGAIVGVAALVGAGMVFLAVHGGADQGLGGRAQGLSREAALALDGSSDGALQATSAPLRRDRPDR